MTGITLARRAGTRRRAVNYLDVPAAGGGASTPDQAGLSPGAGTIDLRWFGSADDWDASAQTMVDWSQCGDTNARYFFEFFTGGYITSGWWNAAGAIQNDDAGDTAVTLGFVNGTAYGLRTVLAPSAGTLDYYWSTDFVNWTHIIQRTGYSTTGLSAIGTDPATISVGQTSLFGCNPLTGKVLAVKAIIGGATVLDMDFRTAALGTGPWVAGSGETWTRTGSSEVKAA